MKKLLSDTTQKIGKRRKKSNPNSAVGEIIKN